MRLFQVAIFWRPIYNMSRFGLLGRPISHSKSPALFFAGYGISSHTYSLFETPTAQEGVELFINGDIQGVNVTSPFKDEVMRFVDLPDIISSILASANVLVKEAASDGNVIIKSFNTDYYGVKNTISDFLAKSDLLPASIKENGVKSVAVVGAGGAGKAAALAMCDAGYEVFLVNRTAGKVADFAASIGATYVGLDAVVETLSRVDLVIYSLSFYLPQLDDVDWESKIVFEANYARPSLSPQSGIKVGLYIDGRYWLYHQALPAFEIFTGKKPNLLEMKKVMGIE